MVVISQLINVQWADTRGANAKWSLILSSKCPYCVNGPQVDKGQIPGYVGVRAWHPVLSWASVRAICLNWRLRGHPHIMYAFAITPLPPVHAYAFWQVKMFTLHNICEAATTQIFALPQPRWSLETTLIHYLWILHPDALYVMGKKVSGNCYPVKQIDINTREILFS